MGKEQWLRKREVHCTVLHHFHRSIPQTRQRIMLMTQLGAIDFCSRTTADCAKYCIVHFLIDACSTRLVILLIAAT